MLLQLKYTSQLNLICLSLRDILVINVTATIFVAYELFKNEWLRNKVCRYLGCKIILSLMFWWIYVSSTFDLAQKIVRCKEGKHTPYIHPTCTLHTPYIHPTYTLNTPYMYPTCTTLHTPYIHPTYTLHVPHIHPTCTLHAPHMYPTYTLHVHYIHPT